MKLRYRHKRSPRIISKAQSNEGAKGSAYRVLEKNMFFWDRHGDEVVNEIKAVFNRNKPYDATKFAAICRELAGTKEKAVDCASKLVNYQAAKQANIKIEKRTTKRYVIVAPSLIDDPKQWLANVEQQKRLLPPQHIPSYTPPANCNANQVQASDIEDIDHEDIPQEYRQNINSASRDIENDAY